MNESFKTDPSQATSARAAKESGSYLCASNVTPTAVRFIVSVFLCLLCSCRMSSTQMTCSHFRKNRPKKRQKPAGCRSRIISKNRPVPIFGRSTGASLIKSDISMTRGQGLISNDKLVVNVTLIDWTMTNILELPQMLCGWTLCGDKWTDKKCNYWATETREAHRMFLKVTCGLLQVVITPSVPDFCN